MRGRSATARACPRSHRPCRVRPPTGSRRRWAWPAPSISRCAWLKSCLCCARSPSTLIGSGKVSQIAALVAEHEAGLAIVDHSLTAIQQRNLEKAWNCKVLDRTGLILEIFGERALTREGRLQVELAHLTHQKGRLVRTWTHLERQRGGFGFLGGPGEAQIEADRRQIDERIVQIRKDLAGVVKTRALHRRGRKRVPLAVVAIVGYTNAGKSTLFNRLTGAGVVAKDQVFATLDPTMREVRLPSGRRIVLSDTVGFISDLPTMLVAAFRATLEEVVEADLVLHVRDISHAETEAQRRDVETVLSELGIDAAAADVPLLEVWNKADKLSASDRAGGHERHRPQRPPARAGVGADRGRRGRVACRHRRSPRRPRRGCDPPDPAARRPPARLAARECRHRGPGDGRRWRNQRAPAHRSRRQGQARRPAQAGRPERTHPFAARNRLRR